MVALDELEINLTSISKFYDEQFVLILREGDPEGNTKEKLPSRRASQRVA